MISRISAKGGKSAERSEMWSRLARSCSPLPSCRSPARSPPRLATAAILCAATTAPPPGTWSASQASSAPPRSCPATGRAPPAPPRRRRRPPEVWYSTKFFRRTRVTPAPGCFLGWSQAIVSFCQTVLLLQTFWLPPIGGVTSSKQSKRFGWCQIQPAGPVGAL